MKSTEFVNEMAKTVVFERLQFAAARLEAAAMNFKTRTHYAVEEVSSPSELASSLMPVEAETSCVRQLLQALVAAEAALTLGADA